MKISNIQQNQPSFKQINLVQIPKKAFNNPDNMISCTQDFYNSLAECATKKSSKISDFLSSIGLSKYFSKYTVLQESPTYMLGKRLSEQYGYSVEYFEQNTKIPFKKALNKDMFSYFVLTKKHHKEASDLCSRSYKKELINYATKEFIKLQQEGKYPSEYVPGAIATKEFEKSLDKIISEDEIHKFELNSIDELKNIVGELNI